jgi:hypothetical protein
LLPPPREQSIAITLNECCQFVEILNAHPLLQFLAALLEAAAAELEVDTNWCLI